MARYCSIALAYDQAWSEGQGTPDLGDFLAKQCRDKPLANSEVLDIVLVDQYHRWQIGKPLSLEDYFQLAPQVTKESALCQKLVLEEFGYLEERDPNTDVDFFIAQYTQYLSEQDVGELRDELNSDSLQVTSDAGSPFSDSSMREKTTQQLRDPGANPTHSSSHDGGSRVGPFKLLQQLGEGGFGTVWMADQEHPVKRRVALKVIKAGMDSKQVIARFEAERQALAMMDHQNIAKVLDAGMTEDGRPYFAMELVQGIPFNQYCDVNKLSLHERLELFVPVCNAVQHAHQKGIIHRDLKPSNVLVTLNDGMPVPKVIDFGLAKALQHQTRLTDKTVFTEFGQIVGTLQYMSPEQAEMNALDVDTRTDVYSLGVMLYELLTGTTPIDQGTLNNNAILQVLQLIKDKEPPRPSNRLSESGDSLSGISAQRKIDPEKLQKILRGELDWVVMKALEKDRTRRYGSAGEFCDDILNYLNDQAVVARPPSVSYKVRKFVRRYKAGVLAASLIVLALVAGLISTAIFAYRAEQQWELALNNAKLARENAAKAKASELLAVEREKETQKVAEFQAAQLGKMNLYEMGEGLKLGIKSQLEIDLGEFQLDQESFGQAIEIFDILLARVNFSNLALESLEQNFFAETLKAIDSQFSEQPLVRARLLDSVSRTMRKLGLNDTALSIQEQAIKIRRIEQGEFHADTLQSTIGKGTILIEQGKYVLATAVLEQAVDDCRQYLGNHHEVSVEAFNEYGRVLFQRAQNESGEERRRLQDRAYAFCREAFDGRLQLYKEDHPLVAEAYGNMGAMLSSMGRLNEARNFLLKAVELGYWSALNSLAILAGKSGKDDEQKALYRECLEKSREKLGDRHEFTLLVMSNLAITLTKQKDPREIEEGIRLQKKVAAMTDLQHADSIKRIKGLVSLLNQNDQTIEAIRLLEAKLGGGARINGSTNDPVTLKNMSTLGDLYRDAGLINKAADLHEQILQNQEDSTNRNNTDWLMAARNLVKTYRVAKRWTNAADLQRQVLDLSEVPIDRARAGHVLAVLLLLAKNEEEYKQLRRKMLNEFAETDDPAVAAIASELTLLSTENGNHVDGAIRLCNRALEKQVDRGLLLRLRMLLGLSYCRQGRFDLVDEQLNQISPYDFNLPLLIRAVGQIGRSEFAEARRILLHISAYQDANTPTTGSFEYNFLCHLLWQEAIEQMDVLPLIRWSKQESIWKTVDIKNIACSNSNVEIVEQDDGSFIILGEANEFEELSITYSANIREVSAIRIEHLCDDRLDFNGPGRHGRFAIRDVKIQSIPATKDDTNRNAIWKDAIALDTTIYHEPVYRAIDADINTHWGSYWTQAQTHFQNHSACFTLAAPLLLNTGDIHVLKIACGGVRAKHERHALGRFRISVTDSAIPIVKFESE